MASRDLTGVLLVGGASRRFGSPKALARIDGKTFAEHAWGILGEACEQRLAFGKAADELPLPFAYSDDGFDVRAPLAGVVAGLRAARNQVCVFVPVDVPFATSELVRALGDACTQAAVPQTGPLPGAFARSALPVFQRRLDAGDLSLREAIAELDSVTVELDPAQLVNINFPSELVPQP